MQVFLPIADVSVDIVVLLGIGGIVGFLSGMFGVGGGFLVTPLLFFVGIPPAVAVATSANHIVASSVSGVLAHFKRKNVDLTMGMVLLAGGVLGSFAGVRIFTILNEIGQLDLIVSICYVLFLGVVGLLMLVESLRAMRRSRNPNAPRKTRKKHTWAHSLPLKMKFRVSGLYIMGVGGGFIMVPAMIYLISVPTKVVIGTSLFQIIFVSIFTTILQAVTNQTVDIILALFLLFGGVVGAQLGAQVGLKLKAEQLRIFLALIVIAVGIKVALDLLLVPTELYTVSSS